MVKQCLFLLLWVLFLLRVRGALVLLLQVHGAFFFAAGARHVFSAAGGFAVGAPGGRQRVNE